MVTEHARVDAVHLLEVVHVHQEHAAADHFRKARPRGFEDRRHVLQALFRLPFDVLGNELCLGIAARLARDEHEIAGDHRGRIGTNRLWRVRDRHWLEHRQLLSRKRTALSNTFAPFAQSCQDVSSFGEWLTPPTLGTKIIPMGVSCAIIWASWPAPEGRRTDDSFNCVAARSTTSCIPASARAGGLRLAGTSSIVVFVVSAIVLARARISSAIDFSFSGERSRSSMISVAAPGTTLGALGETSILPTVPTWRPGRLVTISRTAMVRCEAASIASWRSAMGV